MGSSIAKTSRIKSSASLPSVYGDRPSTAGLLVFTLQKTAEKKETSLNKENLSAQAYLKASNKEKAASDKTTHIIESGKDQSRHFLSSENAVASNSSTPTALDLIQPQPDVNLPVVLPASIAANYATVLLDSPPSVLLPPSELTNFREPSPTSVDSGSSVSKNLYSTSTVIPVWTANMLGNAYGGGYVITPSIFVTNFPDSPSSSGIPPGYEPSSSKPEKIDSSRSPTTTRASVGTGDVFTLVAGPSKEEATLGSASVLDGFIEVLLPTTETEAATNSTKTPPSNASNHSLLKPVAVTNKPSLASIIPPVNETGILNTSLLLPSSASVNLAPFPLISPLVNQTPSLLANQSVIGAYSPTSVLESQGLAFKKTFDYSLALLCMMAMSFIL